MSVNRIRYDSERRILPGQGYDYSYEVAIIHLQKRNVSIPPFYVVDGRKQQREN